MVIDIVGIVDNYVDKMWITFDNIEVELETCQVFLLYSIANWTIAGVKHFYLTR